MSKRYPIIAYNTITENNIDIIDIYMVDTYESLSKPIKYVYSTYNPVYDMNNKQVIETWDVYKTGEKSSKLCYCNIKNVKNVYKT